MTYAFTGLAAAGFMLGASGTIRLIQNADHNRVLNARVKPLMAKRAGLLRRLEYGASPGPASSSSRCKGASEEVAAVRAE